MGKGSVATPSYYEPETKTTEATPVKDPVGVDPKDVTKDDIKKTSQRSLYFANEEDKKTAAKSFYSTGTATTLGDK